MKAKRTKETVRERLVQSPEKKLWTEKKGRWRCREQERFKMNLGSRLNRTQHI